MPVPTFLQITKDQTEDVWCISSIAQFKPGYQFLIVCSSKHQAEEVISKIKDDILNYPTVNQDGFAEVTNDYPHLKDVVRVFKPQ